MSALNENKFTMPDFVNFTSEETARWDKNLKKLRDRLEKRLGRQIQPRRSKKNAR